MAYRIRLDVYKDSYTPINENGEEDWYREAVSGIYVLESDHKDALAAKDAELSTAQAALDEKNEMIEALRDKGRRLLEQINRLTVE